MLDKREYGGPVNKTFRLTPRMSSRISAPNRPAHHRDDVPYRADGIRDAKLSGVMRDANGWSGCVLRHVQCPVSHR